MTLRNLLQSLHLREYLNDDGKSRQLSLLEPCPREMQPKQASPELRDALSLARGLRGAEHVVGDVDLSGQSLEGQYLDEFSPDGISIAEDGCGNSWTLDPESGRVFFFCHDPPVVVYQFPRVHEFLEQLLRTPGQSDLGKPLELWQHRIWGENPNRLSFEQVLAHGGPLGEWAQELGDSWDYVDLSQAQPGDGFSWGESEQIVRRGHWVALSKPKPKKGTGFFSKLLGG